MIGVTASSELSHSKICRVSNDQRRRVRVRNDAPFHFVDYHFLEFSQEAIVCTTMLLNIPCWPSLHIAGQNDIVVTTVRVTLTDFRRTLVAFIDGNTP